MTILSHWWGVVEVTSGGSKGGAETKLVQARREKAKSKVVALTTLVCRDCALFGNSALLPCDGEYNERNLYAVYLRRRRGGGASASCEAAFQWSMLMGKFSWMSCE